VSVRRRNYTVNGVRRQARRYTVEFRVGGQLYRRCTNLTDRKAALAYERDWRSRLERQEQGIPDIRAGQQGLEPLIARYTDYLRALARDEMYIYTTGMRLIRMCREAGWRTLRHIDAPSFERWREFASRTPWRGRIPSARTINQYLDTARQFLAWCVYPEKLLLTNPLQAVRKATAPENEGYRRAGTQEELTRLLRAVNEERRRAYLFALYVPGMRRDTLESLRWGDLHESDKPPWVLARAENFKGRRHQRMPLRADLARMMRAYRAKVKPKADDLVFPNFPSIEELREDLRAAGIDFELGKGRGRLDLHAFRKTAMRFLEQAGVSVREASLLLGHRHVSTTERHYRDRGQASVTGVERMPKINARPAKIRGKRSRN